MAISGQMSFVDNVWHWKRIIGCFWWSCIRFSGKLEFSKLCRSPQIPLKSFPTMGCNRSVNKHFLLSPLDYLLIIRSKNIEKMKTRYEGRWNTNVIQSTAGHRKETGMLQFVHTMHEREHSFLEYLKHHFERNIYSKMCN